MSTERVGIKAKAAAGREKITPASPLGVFDSGVGGLSVLSQIMKKLPHEDIIYLADTARVPYGGRSFDEIIKINREIIPYLIKQGSKMVVMACGTSSSVAYPVLADEYPVEIINLIDPGSEAAVSASRSGRIGVIATAATVNSHAFQNKIKELKAEASVHAAGCPLFVPLIEGGFIESDETRRVAREYLKPLLKQNIDVLILGCTHYPHLSKIIREIAGPGVKLVDPAQEAAQNIYKSLKAAGTLKTRSHPARYEYLVTGSLPQFQEIGSRLLGRPIIGARQITL